MEPALDLPKITQAVPQTKLAPGLYVTPTPIGNAGDLTLRALLVLKSCDEILCEDTRVTSKLLSLYGIAKPLTAYHDRNGERIRPRVLQKLEEEKALALVSDAGLPLISDPGFPLLKAVRAAGHNIEILPGANALLTGLAHSGLAPDRFFFGGFLPSKKGARVKELSELGDIRGTLIFYESPKRLAAVLGDVAEALGNREVAVCRELTKKFEEVRRDKAEALAQVYAEEGAPKGEVVLVIAPPEERVSFDDGQLEMALLEAMADMRLKEAVAEITELSGLPRKRVYDMALALKARNGDE